MALYKTGTRRRHDSLVRITYPGHETDRCDRANFEVPAVRIHRRALSDPVVVFCGVSGAKNWVAVAIGETAILDKSEPSRPRWCSGRTPRFRQRMRPSTSSRPSTSTGRRPRALPFTRRPSRPGGCRRSPVARRRYDGGLGREFGGAAIPAVMVILVPTSDLTTGPIPSVTLGLPPVEPFCTAEGSRYKRLSVDLSKRAPWPYVSVKRAGDGLTDDFQAQQAIRTRRDLAEDHLHPRGQRPGRGRRDPHRDPAGGASRQAVGANDHGEAAPRRG